MPNPSAPGLAQALATLARTPDPTAWALILERSGPAMEALARRLTGDVELARDAVQEALLQIRDSAGSFRPPIVDPDRAARSWILRVTANTALTLRRSQARRYRRERMDAMRNAERTPAVESSLAADELADRIRVELATLPEPTRAAIVLHHCSGLAFSDVATALGIPEGTAKVRVHRGLGVLRERLNRAGFTLSLLAISGLVEQLQASEAPGSFTATSAAHRLFTATTTSSVAFIQRGLPMNTLTFSATAAMLLIGGLGVLLSLQSNAQVPPAPVTPGPASDTPQHIAEIRPLPITADADASAWLKDPLPSYEGNATWGERLLRSGPRFRVEFWTSSQAMMGRVSSVPDQATRESGLDAYAKVVGEVWRLRGTKAEFMSPALAAKLNAPLDGRIAPAGTRTQVLAWFAKHTDMSIRVHDSLGIDDGKLLRWSPQAATNEAWLDGLAAFFAATALLSPDGSVLFYQLPAILPLDANPEFIPTTPVLAYQASLVSRLESPVSLNFEDLGLAEVARRLQQVLHYPVEIDPVVLASRFQGVTLRVEDMKLRFVADFVATVTETELQILPDRLRLTSRGSTPATPARDDPPARPSAAQ